LKFHDFAEQAADLFGFDSKEASALLDNLQADGFDLRSDTLEDWGGEAAEYAQDMIHGLEEPWWDFALDDRFLDDEWIMPGEEWELTADYTET